MIVKNETHYAVGATKMCFILTNMLKHTHDRVHSSIFQMYCPSLRQKKQTKYISSEFCRKVFSMIHTSRSMRDDPLFMRNAYPGTGKWNIPLVQRQEIDLTNVSLLACSDTRSNDSECNRKCGIHFFVDDYRFNGIYNNPEKSLRKLLQYAFLLTPDFSTYADMNMWRQIESVAKNRWCGAFWQANGQKVIPTISWSTAGSYDFCFDGVEEGSIVAVGTIGCKLEKRNFLNGYKELVNRIQPETVLCFGEPFDEMNGNIITVDYRRTGKAVC